MVCHPERRRRISHRDKEILPPYSSQNDIQKIKKI